VTERAPRRDAVTRSLRIASAGAARGHSASATDSADTGCGARTVNKVNSARCLPAGTQTRAPFTCASSDPRIAICSTIATANTTPAHTRCERHARATQLRAAMVPSVQATTPTRRPQCRSTAPPSTPPGPRIGRGEAGRGARARSGRAGGDLLDRGRLPVETRFVALALRKSLRLSASWPRSCSSLTAYGTSFSVGMRASAAARGCKRGLGEGSGDAYERLA
jgi:hypothetical protein